jgi:hypothetical protein
MDDVEKNEIVSPKPHMTLQLLRPLRVLEASQIARIDRLLEDVGPYGEVRLVKVKGRLRFIQRIDSEDA